ncbi:hypothetical protein AGLY_007883 [Aphis glycines]|uniref:HAT C-terminal dimerisation domain-containing protein n=1 Tax=Aphis glycines TaxID=307491 RepID=A0A6G0TNA6_APHGL|nr:hypothetical protein AGLY_007883 [Aphis glycines]
MKSKISLTVYKIVKTQRPFVDLPNEVDLQVLNGINMGNILHSDKTCSAIALHIASVMKKTICQNIISTKKKISILIDESTMFSKLTTLVVVKRTFFEDYPGDPYTFNLYLIELPNTSAETITKSLLDCLQNYGFEKTFLDECLIAFACDGASVMIGKNSGAAMRLKMAFPKLIFWHCSNHRLELAVGDVINEVFGINHFKIFMDKLYALYHQSPKNSNELRKIASSLEIQILKIGRILSVRWVASSKRTVNAVLNNYSVLCKHFSLASMDSTRDSGEKSKYSGLYKMMTSLQFVINLNAMSDALDEVGSLSEYLKRRDITLIEADKSIRTTIRVLDSMATDPGPKLTKAMFRLNEHDIIESLRIFKIDLGQGVIPNNLKPLFKAIATIPISTSECEQNFSALNEIISTLRTSLSIETTAALLFINCVGPPLSEFNPQNGIEVYTTNVDDVGRERF